MRAAALAIAFAVVVGVPGRAAAQPAMTPLQSTVPAPRNAGEQLSVSTAIACSAGMTLATWGVTALYIHGDQGLDTSMGLLFVFGSYIAPTGGHWYAGSLVSRGLGIRTIGLAAMGLGLLEERRCSGSSCGNLAPVLLWSGLAMFAAGAIDDIVTAPGKVRRRNRERGFALAPIATSSSAGLALGGSF